MVDQDAQLVGALFGIEKIRVGRPADEVIALGVALPIPWCAPLSSRKVKVQSTALMNGAQILMNQAVVQLRHRALDLGFQDRWRSPPAGA